MVILASQSPRRSEILREMGISFRVVPSRYEEKNDRPLPPDELVRLQAEGKAEEVWRRCGGEEPVLGADTIVVLDGAVLGKPADEAEAARMLERLSGRTHEVMTGVSVFREGRHWSGVCVSRVTFRKMSGNEIRDYIATGEPMDKAGAYAVQGLGRKFVEQVDGSVSNVIGLPKELTEELLRRAGEPG